MLDRYHWTALSVGDDGIFGPAVLNGEKIHFNRHARTMARESKASVGLIAALRWRADGSGRRHGAGNLIREGCARRLVLLTPLSRRRADFSAQATLTLLCLAISMFVSVDPMWGFLLPWPWR